MDICRPCSLHLGMLNVWTWQSHQTWLREFQSLPVLPVSSPAVQLQASLPFIGSFLPLVSHPVVCPLALSPSLSGRDTWQTVTLLSLPPLLPPNPPTPYFIFLHVRFWSSVPRQRRRVFSVSSDGRIVSAVFTQRPPVLTELAWLDDVPLVQQVPT